MEIEEIFKKISGHMIKGIMIHEELANYYDFLGLEGYKRCHEFHSLDEMCSYRRLCRYYINHYNRLIPYVEIEQPEVIPDSWYSHSRDDVDSNTKKNAVKSGLLKWIEWERETKKLYESMYKELINLDEIACSVMIMKLIKSVDAELKKAERYSLNKNATGYDMINIIEEQPKKHRKYKKKMEKDLRIYLC